MAQLIYLVLGTAFGIILTKADVISWFRIRKMFLFEEAHMFLIIGSAVLVGIVSVKLLKSFNVRSMQHEELKLTGKPYHKGFLIGGFIFGIGWAITGACPGPIFAQIGAGEYAAAFTLTGAVIGAFAYKLLKPKLPH